MSKRKIIISMLIVASILSGCSANNMGTESVSSEVAQAANIKGNRKLKLDKIKYNGLSMSVNKSWEKIDVEGMYLYKINESSNFSVESQEVDTIDIDSYMKEVKMALSATIDVKEVSIKKENYNGYDGRSIEYSYDLSGESIRVYQLCFIEDGFAYVIALCSQEDSMDDYKGQLKECLSKLKIK